uniref:Uncharacterized protein n=1 Tax=Helianthus annuus TaxID=4232 RepID=A0A251VFG8_HELAN
MLHPHPPPHPLVFRPLFYSPLSSKTQHTCPPQEQHTINSNKFTVQFNPIQSKTTNQPHNSSNKIHPTIKFILFHSIHPQISKLFVVFITRTARIRKPSCYFC